MHACSQNLGARRLKYIWWLSTSSYFKTSRDDEVHNKNPIMNQIARVIRKDASNSLSLSEIIISLK